MSQSRIVLWRHGRTAWNAELRWQGQSDIPLDSTGHTQAQAAAPVLAQVSPAAIYSSDLMRAAVTASYLAKHTGIEVVTDIRLRETNGGLWEGLTQSEIHDQFAEEVAAWQKDIALPAGVNGETRDDVASRMCEVIEEKVALHEGETVVFATHGGAARAAMMYLLKMPMELLTTFKVMSNCGWVVLDRDPVRDAWRVSEFNVTATPPLFESHL